MGSTFIGSGGTPGGSSTQVQFNDTGAFGGDAGLTYAKASDTLTLGRITGLTTAHLVLTGGASEFGFGYNVNLAGGAGSSDDGGNISIQGGASTGGQGGAVQLAAGTGTVTGGPVSIAAGTGAANGAATSIFGGAARASSNGNGGILGFYGGGADGAGVGGNISLNVSAGGVIDVQGDLQLATGQALKPDTTSGHTLLLQGYDNNTGPAYVTFLTITNGNSPDFTIAPPAGGATVVIQATTYKSSDGSTGATQDVTTGTLVGKTMSFKNGLLVSFA